MGACNVANRAVLGGNMSIIRIKVKDGIPDSVAISFVANVIADGFVSNNNTQYCYVTRFKKQGEKTIMVYCDKGKSGAHLFQVYTEEV